MSPVKRGRQYPLRRTPLGKRYRSFYIQRHDVADTFARPFPSCLLHIISAAVYCFGSEPVLPRAVDYAHVSSRIGAERSLFNFYGLSYFPHTGVLPHA